MRRTPIRLPDQEDRMAARLRLRARQLEKFCKLAKLTTDDARAEFCGLSPSTWSRVTRGRRAPTATFIAGVLSAFTRYGVEFGDLFDIEVDDADEVA